MSEMQVFWVVFGMLGMFLLGCAVIITMLCKALNETFIDILITALSALKRGTNTDNK